MNRYDFLGQLGVERSAELEPLSLDTVLSEGEVTDVVDVAVESHGRVARRKQIEVRGYTRAVWWLADTDGELRYRIGYPQSQLSELIEDGLVAVSYWNKDRESIRGATKMDVRRDQIFESHAGPDGRHEYIIDLESGEFEELDI